MTDFDKIADLIVEQTGIRRSEIKMSSNLVEDLGLDSLDEVELIMEVEKEFGLDITDEESEKLKTVADIVIFVEENQE
jgi:acyl carrier protein